MPTLSILTLSMRTLDVLSRGTIVTRTHHVHENLCNPVFLLSIVGPENYPPRNMKGCSRCEHSACLSLLIEVGRTDSKRLGTSDVSSYKHDALL